MAMYSWMQGIVLISCIRYIRRTYIVKETRTLFYKWVRNEYNKMPLSEKLINVTSSLIFFLYEWYAW